MADPFTLGLVITAATSAASVLLGPKQPDTNTTGPRVGDTGNTTSAFGQMIPINYGTTRGGANVVWAPVFQTGVPAGLREQRVVHRTEAGKGGGPTATSTTFQYFLTCQLLLGEGVAASLLRLWADNKLIYDARPTSKVFARYPTATIRLLPGDEDQLPDALIESYEGSGNVPAYRGYATVVIEDLPLADLGNHSPQFAAEVAWEAGASTTTSVEEAWGDAYQAPDSDTGDIVGANPNWTKASKVFLDADRGLLWASHHNSSNSFAVTLTLYDLINNKIIAQRYYESGTEEDDSDYATDGRVRLTSGTTEARGMVVIGDHLFAVFHRAAFDDARVMRIHARTFRVLAMGANLETIGAGGREWNDALAFKCLDDIGLLQDRILACHNNDSILVYSALSITDPDFVTGAATLFASGSEIGLSDDDGELQCLAGPDASGYCWVQWDETPSGGSLPGQIGIAKIRVFAPGTVQSGGYGGRGIGVALDTPEYVESFDLTLELYGKTSALARARGIHVDLDTNQLILVFSSTDGIRLVRWDLGSETVDEVATHVDLGLGVSDIQNECRTALRVIRDQTVDHFFVKGAGLGEDALRVNFSDSVNGVAGTRFSVAPVVLGAGGYGLPSGPNNGAGHIVHVARDNSLLVRDASNTYSVWRVFLDRGGQNAADLANVVTDLAERVNLSASDVDVTDLSGTSVRGFEVTARGSARNSVDRLSLAHLFDAVESDNILRFVVRGGASVLSIDADADLAAALERLPDTPERIEETTEDEVDVPTTLEIAYTDQDRDYQAGTARAQRARSPDPSVYGDESQRLELAEVLVADEAAQLAEIHLGVAWTGREKQAWTAPPAYWDLDPADVVTLQREGADDILTRLDEIATGSGALLDLKSIADDPELYSSVAAGSTGPGFVDQGLPFFGSLVIHAVDGPLIKDGHSRGALTGPYLGTRAQFGSFRGAVLHQSRDGLSWNRVNAFDEQVLGGICLTAAAAITEDQAYELDTTTTILLAPFGDESAAAFASITDAQLLTDMNAAWWGNRTDGYELVKFRDATANADGTVTIGGALIRGRRGTARVAVGGHAIGDEFLLLDEAAWDRNTYDAQRIDTTLYLRATPLGNAFDAAEFDSLLIGGTDLTPYEVAHVEATRDVPAANDVRLSWVRQTRIGGAANWGDGITAPPLGEELERYEVVLLAGPNDPDPGSESLSKTFDDQTTTSGADFTAAEQSAAGYDLDDDLSFVIYQISATVGRGFPRAVTVPGV